MLTVTEQKHQASLNCHNCINNVNGSEIWGLVISVVSLDHSFPGNEGLEENHLITGSSQRMNYTFPTDCCLIQLDSINTADRCKKRIPTCTPGMGIVNDFRLVKGNLQELSFPYRHPLGMILGFPSAFSLTYGENGNFSPV